MEVKSRREGQSEATRAALIAVARSLFAERGYAATPTEEVVRRAGVTRGALYHHFRDKEDLFEAVYEQVEEEVTRRVMIASASADDLWRGLHAGAQTFLDECLRPDVQQIVLLDAPAVLGWQRWKEIEARYGLGLLRSALAAAMEAGLIQRQPVDPLAHMLLGALTEAAMMVGRAEDVNAARKEVGDSVARLLDSIGTS